MLGGDRITRVNELVRTEISGLLRREVELPDSVMATVTSVSTSPDLGYATVSISVLPSPRAAEVLAVLQRHVGRIQRLLNRKLMMLTVPRIRFVIDSGEDKAAHVERLLDTLDKPE